MRWRVGVLVIGLVAVGCERAPTADPSQTSTTPETKTAGFVYGNVRCLDDRFDGAIFDYISTATGFGTVGDAIDAFRSESTWLLRHDWHGLILGDSSVSPVDFTDERGWVYLSVELERYDGKWLVTGYQSCSEPHAR